MYLDYNAKFQYSRLSGRWLNAAVTERET